MWQPHIRLLWPAPLFLAITVAYLLIADRLMREG